MSVESFRNLHSHSDDPRWYKPNDEEMHQAQIVEPWSDNIRHAKYISYIYCACILVAAILHGFRLLREQYPQIVLYTSKIPLFPSCVALCRMVGYARIKIGPWRLPAGRYLVICGCFILGTVVWCFAMTPHYRPHNEVGSPPLAIRAGMMAVGMLPFIFALALKLNPISLLSGVSHVHLQYYHQVSSIMFLFFSIVHTVPFIWQPLREEGFERLKFVWHESYKIYWSGTVAIFFLLWICASSLGIFRHMSYEFFVVQHIVTFTLMLAFLFVHVEDLLSSHVWLWAAVGVWLFSVIGRSLIVLFSTDFFVGARSQVRVLASVGHSPGIVQDQPAKFVRMSFNTPLRWHPGQHVYVRFPGMAVTQAHPFTCLSLPSVSPHMPNRLVLLARVHKGITQRLHDHVLTFGQRATKSNVLFRNFSLDADSADSGKTLAHDMGHEKESLAPDEYVMSFMAALDGPYGYSFSLGTYEHSVLIAAGSGITFCLPQVSELVRRAVHSPRAYLTRSVRLVWCVRTLDMVQWVRPELLELVFHASNVPFKVSIELYATREQSNVADADLNAVLNIHVGVRPNLHEILNNNVDLAMQQESTSLSVSVCGTPSMNFDVSRSVSYMNWRLARGSLGSLRDIHLVSESFGM